MTKEAAEILEGYGLEVRKDYSGRGMFGVTTYAIVCMTEEFYSALAEGFEDSLSDEERHHLAVMLRNLSKDSMGAQVIYY